MGSPGGLGLSIGYIAERPGFEPGESFWGSHDFQSCSFALLLLGLYCLAFIVWGLCGYIAKKPGRCLASFFRFSFGLSVGYFLQ